MTLFQLLVTALVWTNPAPSEIQRGVVIDTIRCTENKEQSYALYLPRNYTDEKKWTLILFHEPSAEGVAPVALYKELAEKYQIILAASNNSRNGPIEPTIIASEAMMKDVLTRFSIAKDRIIVSGFSGGARASILLTLKNDLYAGIIGCGAGFYGEQKLTEKQHVPYVQIAGNRDLNLLELMDNTSYLTNINYPTTLLIFEGNHEWPPAYVYEQGLAWLWLKLDQKVIVEDNKAEVRKGFVKLIKSQLDSGDFFLASKNMECMKGELLWQPLIDSLDKMWPASFNPSTEMNNYLRLANIEKQWKNNFYEQLSLLNGLVSEEAMDIHAWKEIIRSIHYYHDRKDRQEQLMSSRMEGNFLVGCFSQHRGLVRGEDFFHAALTVQAALLLKKTPTYYYLLAIDYASQGRKKQAMNALHSAADFGMTNKVAIEKNKYLSTLSNEKGYQSLIKKIETNKANKLSISN